MVKKLFLLILLANLYTTFSQITPPSELQSYYSGVNFSLTSTQLYDDLATETIAKHSNILEYTERHNYLYNADADLNNNSNVILMYNSESRDAREYLSGSNSYTPQTFNTEHVYPQSLIGNTARGDLHHLRTCDVSINSSRGNKPFTNGTGTYGNKGDFWYPGDEWKGDVARMILYLNLRYNEPFSDVGSLNLFLQWNVDDPVSDFEIQRNNVIANAQGNRNPFIDNPYLATIIWGGVAAENRWSTLNTSNYDNLNSTVVYPNPSSTNSITITIPNELSISKITLYSVIGSKIYEEKNTNFINNRIRIKDLKSGVYLLKIENTTSSITKKIIIR